MNKAIYKMELIRNLKSFIIWTSSICGILFLGMLFYPAINANGLLSQMEALFENPMMIGNAGSFWGRCFQPWKSDRFLCNL
jgi:hypothetical protein